MSSSQLPNTAIPKPLPEDDDDVSWALQTAAVQWGRGAYQDAIVWLRRAAESAIEGAKWSRAADLNAMATRLEKQLSRVPAAPSVAPSTSPRPAILPSFPASSSSVQPLPAFGSYPSRSAGSVPGPPPRPGRSSLPVPLSTGRPSVDVSIEAGLGELTEEELRAIESESGPPSATAPDVRRRVSRSDALPAFALEPSVPFTQSGLPAFSVDSSGPPPSPRSTAPSPGPSRVPEHNANNLSSSLPSFPLEIGTSSAPPVAQWPRARGQRSSHLPPQPALPSFDAVPPDDGAPGVEIEEVLPEQVLEELEPLEISESVQPAPPSRAPDSVTIVDHSDLVDFDSTTSNRAPSTNPSSLGHLSVRPSRTSAARRSSAPLPPAVPDTRMTVRTPPRLPDRTSRPPVPSRSSSAPSFEPRMPKRTLSYALPSSRPPDERDSGRPETEPSPRMLSNRPHSDSPTMKQMEIAAPLSVPPPSSARSLEPEDLPTVSSPSLSRPPSDDLRSHPPSEGPHEGYFSDAREDARRFSYRFEEEAKTLEKMVPEEIDELSGQQFPDVPTPEQTEEPPASLPPVSVAPAYQSQLPDEQAEEPVMLCGIRLADVRGFADLPASALRMLAETARIETLAAGEEASFFSVALVLDGWVALMPAIADTTCATAVVGEVVFTEGTLSDGLMLRVVAGQDNVAVATWDAQAITDATKDCPWVADDLKLLADGFQALAGACLGPLGDRLDDSLRSIVTSRCEIRTLMPGEQMCAAGKPVPGMHIIGGGEIELVDDGGRVTQTFGTGEFLFAPQVLAGGVAPFSARAGSKGALVLFAQRMAAHELLVSVPPLLEILAE